MASCSPRSPSCSSSWPTVWAASRYRIAPVGFLFPGLALFAFGWAYPHFLDSAALLPYLYRAPTGLIPCPTLAIVIGLALLLDGLGSRRLCLALGIVGLFFGVFGVARLGVAVDWTLLLGAVVILARAALRPTMTGPAA